MDGLHPLGIFTQGFARREEVSEKRTLSERAISTEVFENSWFDFGSQFCVGLLVVSWCAVGLPGWPPPSVHVLLAIFGEMNRKLATDTGTSGVSVSIYLTTDTQ